MFGAKKYYSGHQLKNYDINEREKVLKGVYLSDFNGYTPKDFLSLKKIYDSNNLNVVLAKLKNLKYNKNKVSVPFLETLFYSKYDLELLPFDLKIKNVFDSIQDKLNDNYKIKEFLILSKSSDTFNLNLLFMMTYNKKGKLYCDLIYQDKCDNAINNFKKLLDSILENKQNYFLKYFDDNNFFQDDMISSFLKNNKKQSNNYFVNKFTYDFDSPFFRQINRNFLYKDKYSFEDDDEFDFDDFDEYFDAEVDEMFNDNFNPNILTKTYCYELFGLTSNASISEIKRAYRAKARMYHPDINKSADGEKKFKEINAAYRLLIGKDSKETDIK
ncbi:DnaJ domain-containing protein [Malacoplasma muris]|uniref:DnaJ domain-containing protein n=1 Tax=Malacoplasma muris TaxID=2119 RepID=UPI00398F1486